MIDRVARSVDGMLNRITMYQLMLYGLSVLLAGAMVLNLVGSLPISWIDIGLSLVVILVATYIADRALATLWNAPANLYSSLITALILCCIMLPSRTPHNLALLALSGLLAMLSKYVFALNRKHLFNPAAIAALILGLTNLLPAIWWVGSPALLPLTAIFGLLVLRKLRRFQMFLYFLGAALLITIALGLKNDLSIGYILATAFKSSPLVFLGTVMLTEPTTMPPRQWQRYVYGAIVGALFTSQLNFGRVTATPEAALIVGNIYAYLMSPKYKLRLKFKARTQLAPQIYDFTFTGAKKLNFQPGQYLEWTLPQHKSDTRGNRRSFSIASPPEEDEIHIAIKLADPGSTFKRDLMALGTDDYIMAGQLTGDFILADPAKQKAVFIAGGIGVTPFVSMAKTMVKQQQKRDVVLFYLVAQPSDFCYQKLWDEAAAFGLRTIPVLTNKDSATKDWPGLTGRLAETDITDAVPDYQQRDYYISGPPGLVHGYRQLLQQLSIKQRQIVTDYFSGY